MSLFALVCASVLALPGAEPAMREVVPGVRNFAVVSPTLSRGAQPTREGFEQLRERGIRTILDLRWLHGDDKALAGLGLNSYRLRAKQWHPEVEDVVRAMKVILTPEYQPVFVHCQAGKDRTGLVVAVYRILVDGWSVDDALAERKAFGASDFWWENKTYLKRLDASEARCDLMAAISAAPVPPVVRAP
jgi:tyrosine-protein phosphatase SIW14